MGTFMGQKKMKEIRLNSIFICGMGPGVKKLSEQETWARS